jgi:hypothetical protein
LREELRLRGHFDFTEETADMEILSLKDLWLLDKPAIAF